MRKPAFVLFLISGLALSACSDSESVKISQEEYADYQAYKESLDASTGRNTDGKLNYLQEWQILDALQDEYLVNGMDPLKNATALACKDLNDGVDYGKVLKTHADLASESDVNYNELADLLKEPNEGLALRTAVSLACPYDVPHDKKKIVYQDLKRYAENRLEDFD